MRKTTRERVKNKGMTHYDLSGDNIIEFNDRLLHDKQNAFCLFASAPARNGITKKLGFDGMGNFTVLHGDKTVHIGTQSLVAVEEYLAL